LPTIRHLTERQYQVFFLFHSVIARFKPTGFNRLVDTDVADATAAVAATLETSERGIIYEHAPPGPPAQALTDELRTTLDHMREQGATVYDHEAAVVLRAIEAGARSVQGPTDQNDARTTYLDLLARLLQATGLSAPETPEPPGSRLIVP
jgi:hypothetical protein